MQHLLLGTILTLVISPMSGALDLTPTPGFRTLEDVKIAVLFFEDGPRQVQWQAPARWTFSGDGKSVTLRPPDTSGAAMEIRLISINAAKAPDGTSAPDDLLKWAQA